MTPTQLLRIEDLGRHQRHQFPATEAELEAISELRRVAITELLEERKEVVRQLKPLEGVIRRLSL